MQEEISIEEEYYNDWLDDNINSLEYDFYCQIPPEDQPLDDDIQEYMDNQSDEFEAFCREEFKEYDHTNTFNVVLN